MSEPGTPRSERLFWHIMALVMTGVAISTALNHDPPASITFWLAALVIALGEGDMYRDIQDARSRKRMTGS